MRNEYDYIIIDTPPALGTLTVNALTASDSIIIPAQADKFSLQGISQLCLTVQAIRQYSNNKLCIRGIVLTRYNKRAIISREIAGMLSEEAQKVGTKVYKTMIRECTAIKEAQAVKVSIFDYAPKCNASLDFESLVKEILEEDQ